MCAAVLLPVSMTKLGNTDLKAYLKMKLRLAERWADYVPRLLPTVVAVIAAPLTGLF